MEDQTPAPDKRDHTLYYPHSSGLVYTETPSNTPSQNIETAPITVPPIHRLLMKDHSSIDMDSSTSRQPISNFQYLAHVSPYIKSELATYENIQAQHNMKSEYAAISGLSGVETHPSITEYPGVTTTAQLVSTLPTYYIPRTTEELSTELLKLQQTNLVNQANLINAEIAATADVSQPMNLQHGMDITRSLNLGADISISTQPLQLQHGVDVMTTVMDEPMNLHGPGVIVDSHALNVNASDISVTHPLNVHASAISVTHPLNVHSLDTVVTHSSNIHAPDISTTHPLNVHGSDIIVTHPLNVHGPDIIVTHPSNVHGTDIITDSHTSLKLQQETDIAAATIAQPLNLQQSAAHLEYKHPMLHLYDAAMQQQQEEKYKYEISSSSDSGDSSSDEDDEDESIEDIKPKDGIDIDASMSSQHIKPMCDVEGKNADSVSYLDVKVTDKSVNMSRENNMAVETTGTSSQNSTQGVESTHKTAYDCGKCGTGFVVQCGKSGHSILDKFQCELCEREFSSIDLLQTHVKSHYEKVGPVDLRVMDSTKSPPKQDGMVKTPAKCSSIECGICGCSFKSKSSLKRHERTHSQEKSYGCKDCKRKFLKVDDLNSHSCKTKDFTCDLCIRHFVTEAGLLSHQRSSHKITMSFKCHICKDRFPEEYALNEHLATHVSKVVPEADEIVTKGRVRRKCRTDNPSANTRSSSKTTDDGGEDDDVENDDFNIDSSDTEDDDHDVSFGEIQILDIPNLVDENLDEHMGKFTEVHAGGVLSCVICDQKFADKEQLKSHVREHFYDEYRDSDKSTDMRFLVRPNPSDNETFTCHMCSKSYPSSFALGIHISSHHTSQGQGDQLKCLICGDGFSYRSCLKKHLKRQHGHKSKRTKTKISTTQPTCEICERTFKDEVNLRRHAIVHDEEKQFNCKFCGKNFSRQDGLRAHIRTHTGEKPYKCGVCGMCCATSSGLNIHKKSHNDTKPFSCEICGKNYKYRLSLNLHASTHSGTKPYTCDICERSFYDPSSFKKHKVIHTGIKAHICHVCGNSFFRRESLTKHLKTHNPTYTKKLHPCPLCPKVYNAASGLIIHKRTHSGEKPFQCEFCLRNFATKSTLLSHSRTHSGVKPYVCEHCGKRFIQATPLKMHMKRVHNPVHNPDGSLTWVPSPEVEKPPSSSSTSKQSAPNRQESDLPTQVPNFAYDFMYGYTHPSSLALPPDVPTSASGGESHWHIASGVMSNSQAHHVAPSTIAVTHDNSPQQAIMMEHGRLLPDQRHSQSAVLSSLLGSPTLNASVTISNHAMTLERRKHSMVSDSGHTGHSSPVAMSQAHTQPHTQPLTQSHIQSLSQPHAPPHTQPHTQSHTQPLTQAHIQSLSQPHTQPHTQLHTQPHTQSPVMMIVDSHTQQSTA